MNQQPTNNTDVEYPKSPKVIFIVNFQFHHVDFFSKVHQADETTLRAKPLNPVMHLYFLKHYYETCAMTGIELSTAEDCLRFGNGHEFKLRKKAKVNFRITYSEILKPPSGELYTVDAVVFFLQHFVTGNRDYKEYLQKAMAQRVPIVAHRGTVF